MICKLTRRDMKQDQIQPRDQQIHSMATLFHKFVTIFLALTICLMLNLNDVHDILENQ